MDKATAERLVTDLLIANALWRDVKDDKDGDFAANFGEAKQKIIKTLTTPPSNPQGEKFICLGCGDLDAEIITESDPTGMGDGDEICKKCGQNDFADSMEDAIATLIKSYSKLHDAYFELQHKTLDKEIEAARVPPEATISKNVEDFGYQPGDYTGTCRDCGFRWLGQGKKSFRCIDCAMKARDNATKDLPVPEVPPEASRIQLVGDSGDAKVSDEPTFLTAINGGKPAEPLHDRLLEAAKAVAKWHESPIALESDGVMYEMREAIEAIEKETQGKDRA